MGKQRGWQLACIIAVLLWTIYNVLPTLIYYSRPLERPVDAKMADSIAKTISERVNQLEDDSVAWLHAFCKMVGVSPKKIQVDEKDPARITLEVSSEKEAEIVQRFLPRAGQAIPFKPAQLLFGERSGKTIQVIRRVGVKFNDPAKIFRFFEKRNEKKEPTDQYFACAKDRLVEVAACCSGPSVLSSHVDAALRPGGKQAVGVLADELTSWMNISAPQLQNRLLKSLFYSKEESPRSRLDSVVAAMQKEISALQTELSTLQSEPLSIKSVAPENKKKEQLLLLRSAKLRTAVDFLQSKKEVVGTEPTVVPKASLYRWVDAQRKKMKGADRYQFVLADRHPVIQSVALDWTQDQLILQLQDDVAEILAMQPSSENIARTQELVRQLVFNEIARISTQTRENFQKEGSLYLAALSQTPTSQGVLAIKIDEIAKDLSASMMRQLTMWEPTSLDLQPDAYPRMRLAQYNKADSETQKLCLLVVGPAEDPEWPTVLKKSSLYVILKGGQKLFAYDEKGTALRKDFEQLAALLERRGFLGYSGDILGSPQFSGDIVFELENCFTPILEATRESFVIPGTLNMAMLECGTVESRILAENRIDDAMQEELIRWKESWQAGQVSLNPADRFVVPKPIQNVLWSNLKRSGAKYLRGDDSRVIRWGLDLSGGKSIRVCLLDQAGRTVIAPQDLKQATSELYSRLNKMGVAERTIRVENTTITIDFPGVRGLSAAELVKASAMYFHVVNEKFGPLNPDTAKAAHAFLQEVWNEAVVTNKKDGPGLNAIAWDRIQAVKNGNVVDENAKLLIDQGLLLCDPASSAATSAFDDRVSMVARWQGEDPAEWPMGSGHPLMFVFRNFALEGCNLENVHPSYDPSKGNILLFGVRRSDARGQEVSPRDEFHLWTSQFSEEGISGTPREKYSHGRGWRMAVLLNGVVVSSPQLSSALKDSAMISGNFSQREVQKLAANLQAGSLSFTPKIVSEQNVSPELGVKERHRGLASAGLALVAVITIMVAYYRFCGVVASAAVLCNLLILWAVMQNIEAAITLPAIAGIVLTVAMAVDANVLVFERIREEFSVSGRIASAITRGYQKALSAIIDSNLTTLIAAFILTRFDSGPVRGFAMTLIVGLISSLFTSLFVTRYYFTGWAANPAHTELKMANWIRSPHFDFLSWKRVAIVVSAGAVVVGLGVGAFTWRSMLGMDFTGGYALIVEASSTTAPKETAEKALLAQGVLPGEIQIRELGRPTALRIQLSSSLEEQGRPFYGLSETVEGAASYEYQKNPRLEWVITTLENGGLTINAADKEVLAEQWTAISGQFSDAMRNNALIALAAAVAAILVYIAIRFEWKYAISAVLALLHDVVLTLAVLAVLHFVGVPLQINLEVIGALMTIIGYALNDTIIVFDRVREDLSLYRKKSFSEVVNLALNSTLSRTLMTSGITLVVLLCLVCFGGPSIFAFSFVMFLGVLLGTFSSLFIAGPLLVFFHAKEENEER
jgi:SecD/SecF fusion protein